MLLILNQISKWKNELILPEQAIRLAEGQETLLAAKIYQSYTNSLRAFNAVDFDDLILLPTLLLKNEQEIRAKWHGRIRYLLVDEYQDTNTSQYELVKLLTGRLGNFTVVGDDDQSIYSWRGAQPKNLELLQKDFPNLRVVKLEQNYRSAGRILKSANALIQNNPHVFKKKLWSEKHYGDPIRVLSAKDDNDEADRVTNEILSRRINNNIPYKKFAILYRSNHQSRLLEKFFVNKQIPYKISGTTSFFARSEIKDVMAYFRLLINQDDDNAFIRIANVPRREIGVTTLEKLGYYANGRYISLFDAIFEVGLEQNLSGKGLAAVKRFGEIIAKASDNIKRGDSLSVVRDLLAHIGYHGFLMDNSNSPTAAGYRWNNVETLISWVETGLENEQQADNPFAETVSKLCLREMLDREKQEQKEDSNEVQLMTLHASKGLEFPHVYLIGMEENILPHKTSIEEGNIEEERRLAYVGITRAEESLSIFTTKKRQRYGDSVDSEVSRFLHELPQDDLEWEDRQPLLSDDEKREKGKDRLAEMRKMLSS